MARQNDQNELEARTCHWRCFSGRQCLPKMIIDYTSHVSNVQTPTGIKMYLYLPDIGIPDGPDPDLYLESDHLAI